MISRLHTIHLVLTASLFLLAVRPAHATKIDRILLEELVLSADMVALVECETAGGLTARFKVVEAFKGPKAGTSVVLEWPANYWGEQFPIALCGDRFFVTAFTLPPNNLISTSMGAPVPFWWRRIPADFGFPLMQGMYDLTPEEEKGDFQKKRKKVQALLAMNAADQEAALLRALIDENLLKQAGKDAKAEALRIKYDGLKTAKEQVTELLRLANEDWENAGRSVYRILNKGGMAETQAILNQISKDENPWVVKNRPELLESIQSRLKKPELGERPKPTPEGGAAPSEDKKKVWREVLPQREAEEWGEAFVGLTHHDPASVVEMLLKLEKPKGEHRRERDENHSLASYFAAECGKPREKHLSALLESKDPWVRVAGAVYLCFENENEGVEALKKLTALEGTPGGWAALTLARRGHKEAMPRAIKLFPEQWTAEDRLENFGTVHENLQNHLLVLLSNSASAGKAPQFRAPKDRKPTSENLLTWWKQHQEKLVLRDPWMEVLSKQKID